MGSARNINLGLDLEGGVSITYQVKGDTPSQEDMTIQCTSCSAVWKSTVQRHRRTRKATTGQHRDPGVQDANEILEELGQPGSLYFIREKDSDGNANYSVNSDGTAYELNKSIDELEADGSIVLTGTDIANAAARSGQDQTTGASQSDVELQMTDEGTEKFAAATEEAAENNETIAIYYDGTLVSVPRVNEAIENGEAVIEGMASYEEADSLASTIRIGGLNVELEEMSSQVVGAQLGQEAISTSLLAGLIGLIIVCVFMCCVYYLPGFASSLALIIYTELILFC